MRPTEEITIEAYRKLAGTRQRPKRGGIPRAEREPRTGLTTLLRAGWSVQSPDAVRYRLYRGPLDTGLCESERAACERAKELSK